MSLMQAILPYRRLFFISLIGMIGLIIVDQSASQADEAPPPLPYALYLPSIHNQAIIVKGAELLSDADALVMTITPTPVTAQTLAPIETYTPVATSIVTVTASPSAIASPVAPVTPAMTPDGIPTPDQPVTIGAMTMPAIDQLLGDYLLLQGAFPDTPMRFELIFQEEGEQLNHVVDSGWVVWQNENTIQLNVDQVDWAEGTYHIRLLSPSDNSARVSTDKLLAWFDFGSRWSTEGCRRAW